MTTQQILIAETISGLRKALKRKAYDSDSDSSIDQPGNRGIKLKKRARYARLGQLAPPSGPETYREAVLYDGLFRDIIHRKPPLVDEDGYEVDSDDDDERIDEAALAAVKSDPYASVNLEQIFAPLRAVTELSTHPSMARPFTSKMLTQLADESSNILRKENGTLWKTKRLMAVLCGDYFWAPCRLMQAPTNVDVYSDDFLPQQLISGSTPLPSRPEASEKSTETVNGYSKPSESDGSKSNPATANGTARPDGHGDVAMADAGSSPREEIGEKPTGPESQAGDAESVANGGKTQTSADKRQDPGGINALVENGGEEIELVDSDARLDTHPASNAGEFGLASEPPHTPSLIHPLFAPPPNARSDRDVGLATNEADELRSLLALYIQKQEEVCRGMTRLNEGLLRADRMRKEVLHWSKAEAHCGPNRDMSDGEDWYDLEEWGLDAALNKGQDEEEEDSGTTAKKTRARR